MSEHTVMILALTPLAEDALEQALFAPEARFEIAASVAEADELEAQAAETGATVVLLSPDLSGLSPGHCARLRALGHRLVGLALDADTQRQLERLGVDAFVEPDASTATLGSTLRGDQPEDAKPPAPAARATSSHNLAGNGRTQRDGRGNVLAVLGGKGAPGASECAVSLAALAGERWSTVLVELDTLGGGLDLRLNADPNAGSLIAAVRAADDERAVAELLERWLVRRPGWAPVLLGPPEPERVLGELAQPGAITGVLASLTRSFSLVVCDVGWQLTGDAAAARVHREAVVAADAVLLVLGAREQQLRPGLAQLDHLLGELELPAERIRIALNALGGPGGSAKATLLTTVNEQLADRGLTLDAVLPWDARALARSMRLASPLAGTGRRSGYRRALGRLLDELFLPTQPAPRRRKVKLAVPARTERSDEEVSLPWRT
ncbi:MAG: AAA family ATPase [Gaiellaceae bacterium]